MTDNTHNGEISLVELIQIWWEAKWIILGSAVVSGAVAALVTLMIPDQYRARAVLAPAGDMSPQLPRSLAAQVSSLSGLTLGGVGADATQVALATIKSRSFLVSFVRRHELEVPLIAGKGWDFESQSWIIDPDIYDPAKGQWVRKVSQGRPSAPTDGEIFEKLIEQFEIDYDRATHLVTLTLRSLSPVAARDWAMMMINDLNSEMRTRAEAEASSSITYLERQVAETDIASVRDVFHSLIEDQIRTKMLAAVRQNYAFTVIDPPMLPEMKVFPNRTLICIVVAFAGGLIAAVIVFIARSLRASRSLG